MVCLADVMDRFGLSVADVARITGHNKSTISQIRSGYYRGKNGKEQEILEMLAENGYMLDSESVKVKMKNNVFIMTKNVEMFNELAEEMLDLDADLTSSIGVVIGRAGRGKTRAARHFCIHRQEAIYVQFLDGFSLVDVAREIAYEFGGVRPRSFRACLDVIEESTINGRRIVVIDEADKMPKKFFEMIRGINERCSLPVILVGEEGLRKTLDTERRLKSRTRRVLVFEQIGVEDVIVYYQEALGIEIGIDIAKHLHKRASGDFRFIVNDAINIARLMNINNVAEITKDILRALDE